MENTMKSRTLEVIAAELNASVDKYNATSNAEERVALAIVHLNLVREYNEISLLNAYATFMAAENPLIALAEKYYYGVISVKDAAHTEIVDGTPKSSVTRSVKYGSKKLDVVKFIEWTEECNKSVAAATNWKTMVLAARNSIADEWKKFFAAKKDTHAMSIGKTKKALQAMFDALVFVPSETGKNAIIANGDIAKWVLAFANERKDTNADGNVNITGYVLKKTSWNTLLLDMLHKAVTGKDFEIVYGEPEEDAAAAAETVEDAAE